MTISFNHSKKCVYCVLKHGHCPQSMDKWMLLHFKVTGSGFALLFPLFKSSFWSSTSPASWSKGLSVLEITYAGPAPLFATSATHTWRSRHTSLWTNHCTAGGEAWHLKTNLGVTVNEQAAKHRDGPDVLPTYRSYQPFSVDALTQIDSQRWSLTTLFVIYTLHPYFLLQGVCDS